MILGLMEAGAMMIISTGLGRRPPSLDRGERLASSQEAGLFDHLLVSRSRSHGP
jgi:hypothetical protein